MHNTTAIILAGGKGERLDKNQPKQFMPLKGRPLILWSVETFAGMNNINKIIIISPEEYIAKTRECISDIKTTKKITILPGGPTRRESSYNAVFSQNFKDDDVLLIHDAARPFVKKNDISAVIEAAETYGAAGLYSPVTDTIASVKNGFVSDCPDRDSLLKALTPQAFRFNIIKKAHELCAIRNDLFITDDVSMVIHSGIKVKCVAGDSLNFKITTKEDFTRAQYTAEKFTLISDF